MRGHLQTDVLTSRLKYVHAKHKSDPGVFPTDIRLAFPQLDVGVPELQDASAVDSVGGKMKQRHCEQTWGRHFYTDIVGFISHGFHVVLWLQWDLQDFGAIDDPLVAVGGDRLASDPVNLIKGVRLQDALICGTNKNLEANWIFASVAVQLQTQNTHSQHWSIAPSSVDWWNLTVTRKHLGLIVLFPLMIR